MSNFQVSIVKIDAIEPIENADAIEIVKIADYRSITRKGQFQKGSLAVYIPEGAICPEWLLEHMGLVGKLAGKEKNRVRAIKLRGVFSQGLTLAVEPGSTDDNVLVISQPHDGNQGAGVHKLGDNIMDSLGITKWEPQVPTCMGGEVCNIDSANTIAYDIENLKRYPHLIKEGVEIVVGEKIHGTHTVFGYVPNLKPNPELLHFNKFAASKGLGAKGLVFKNNEANANNIYLKSFNSLNKDGLDIFSQLEKLFDDDLASQELVDIFQDSIQGESQDSYGTEIKHKMIEPIYLLGETFGSGVQDLTYGLSNQQFRLFDIYLGRRGQGRYLNVYEKLVVANVLGIDMVPILYQGPFDRSILDELVRGQTVAGNNAHIREGIVITPVIEESNDEIGRTILKHINEDYLLRNNKNATEFN